MPKPGKRYGLEITVQPYELDENGDRTEMGVTHQSYPPMEYGEMVMVQQVAITGLVDALCGKGLEVAEEMKKQCV